MFEKKTVLVLGAGASYDYGYPLGADLINQVKELASLFPKEHIHYYAETELQAPLYIQDAPKLVEAIEFYKPLSIDVFLAQQVHRMPSVEKLGKTLISQAILNQERPLKQQMPEMNWFRFLWHALTANTTPDTIEQSLENLKIITFNYDVSLEYLFYLYAKHEYSYLDPQQAQNFLTNLANRIFHVYGAVQLYDWQKNSVFSSDNYVYRAEEIYGLNGREEKIRVATKSDIRLIGERANQIDIAHAWLKEAESIYFLGYGFDQTNNKVLDLETNCRRADKIYLINLGLSRRINSITKNLFSYQKVNKVDIQSKQLEARRDTSIIVSSNKIYKALNVDFNLIWHH